MRFENVKVGRKGNFNVAIEVRILIKIYYIDVRKFFDLFIELYILIFLGILSCFIVLFC